MAVVSAPAAAPPRTWLFSPAVDLGVFLGSALASLLALAVGARLGVLHAETPGWAWVPAVLLVDVAHVWATAFRVYLDPRELRARPGLYLLTPVLGYLVGVALYSEGSLLFWRVLAYLAVFHFVRQQYGWVALYRARRGEEDRAGYWLDTAAIYLATLYPLLYWHAHLPASYGWLLAGDLVPLPSLAPRLVAPVYWAVLGLYVLRSPWRWWRHGLVNPGKDIVVATTAVCWHVGMITFTSDYAFTVTNVLIHGVPYLALVFWYWRGTAGGTSRTGPRALLVFLASVWLAAYVEELFWYRAVWHEQEWLFGTAWQAEDLQGLLVPLLAVPQLTHYVLDGFIWKRRHNPGVQALVR